MREDGTTFPVEISLVPVTIAGRSFTLAMIRDISQALRLESLAGLSAAARQDHASQQPSETIIPTLVQVRSYLHAALGQSAELTWERIATALDYLDDAIRVVAGTAPARDVRAVPPPVNGAR